MFDPFPREDQVIFLAMLFIAAVYVITNLGIEFCNFVLGFVK